MRPWAKLPTWWYRDEERGLQRLLGGAQAGTSQAALRVYLGAAAIERPVDSFEVALSLTELEKATGLSRPTVKKGLDLAEQLELIRVTRGSPTAASKIQLVCPEHEAGKPGGWAKLPAPEVLIRVPRLPHRGFAGLIALKVYATLVAARPNESLVVQLRHITLRNKTGAQPRDIRRAITLLGNEGLIDVNQEDPALRWGADSERGAHAQRYLIVGKLDAPRGRLSLQPNAPLPPTGG